MGISSSRGTQERSNAEPAATQAEGLELQQLNADTASSSGSETLDSGVYFGPRFILDFSQHPYFDTELLRSELTRIFWDEIWNVLSQGGSMTQSQLSQLGNMYQPGKAPIQATTTLQAQVNLLKNTLRLSKIARTVSDDTSATVLSTKDQSYGISFKYDSNTPCMIRLYWVAHEKIEWCEQKVKSVKYIPKGESEAFSWSFGPFPGGLQQTFELPATQLFEPSCFETHDLVPESDQLPPLPANDDDGVDADGAPDSVTVPVESPTNAPIPTHLNHFPLIVVLESLGPDLEPLNTVGTLNTQITYVRFVKRDDALVPKIIKQKIIIEGIPYILQDIYGFSDTSTTNSPSSQETDDLRSMRECVVCMSAPKDTIAIPCRHLCVCKECAEVLRNSMPVPPQRPNPPKCPICRQVLHSLLQIVLPKEFRREGSRVSLISKSAPMESPSEHHSHHSHSVPLLAVDEEPLAVSVDSVPNHY